MDIVRRSNFQGRIVVFATHIRHTKTCKGSTKLIYPCGYFQTKQTIFDELEGMDILVPGNDHFFPWFAVFDFAASTLKWTMNTYPSHCSNFPSFTSEIFSIKLKPE